MSAFHGARVILVTGGAGFIGSHTVEALLAAGERVRVLDDLSTGSEANLRGLDVELIRGSIEVEEDLVGALRSVHGVVHLAARVSVPDSFARPVAYERTNVLAFVSLLHAARAAGVRRVVYASSCAVYGSLPGLPKREDAALAPSIPYAVSKAADELYARCLGSGPELEAVGMRYFNVFGPRQDPAGPYGAVIPKFVELALAGEPLVLHGDGEQGRDFVSVRDVAAANLAALRAEGVGGEVFNVGGGRMTTVNQLAEVVAHVVQRPVERRYTEARQGDVRHSLACVQAARQRLGWQPRVDFDAALAETVAWFRARGGGQR